MWRHHKRAGSGGKDLIATRRGAVSSEHTLPVMSVRNKRDSHAHSTMVHPPKRFEAENQRPKFPLNPGTEAKDASVAASFCGLDTLLCGLDMRRKAPYAP